MHEIFKQALAGIAPEPIGPTPGPWQVMNDYDGATTVIANVDGETFSDGTASYSYDFVCDTLGDDDDSRSRLVARANARLIASLPDMVMALREARETLAAWMVGQVPPDQIADHSTIKKIDAAIALVDEAQSKENTHGRD